MWQYSKKLEYPVKIKRANPAMAKLIISQLGGPNGETGAALRYLSQRYGMPSDKVKGVLTDIGTEESQWHTGFLVAFCCFSWRIPLRSLVLGRVIRRFFSCKSKALFAFGILPV